MIRTRRSLATLAFVALALGACQGEAPRLGATEQHIAYVSPVSWDFGPVGVNGVGAPRNIILGISGAQNESRSVLSISEGCADFSLDLSTIELPASISRFCETCPTCAQAEAAICETETQHFMVSFAPTVAGPQACAVTIQLDNGTKTLTLMGTGVAPDYDLTLLSPADSTLAFGDVVVNQPSATLSIVVRSDGTMPLDVMSADFNGSGDPSQFSLGNAGPFTLQQGETRELTVQCIPTAAVATGAAIDITSNDPAQPVVTIDLSCNGIQSDLAINPSPRQFPETFVGDTASSSVNLFNSGGAPMVVEDIWISPPLFAFDALNDPGIPSMSGQDLQIYFSPDDTVVDQDVHGTLTVFFDGGQTRTIDLIGPARSAVLSVTPGGDVDFGTVCGGQSQRKLFAAINLGSGAFDLTGAEVSGDGFMLTLQPSLPASLPARGGATAAFEVQAMPAPGDVTGVLTLTPGVANLAPATVNLLARGQADGIAAAPAELAFDAVVVREGSGGESVSLTNCESLALNVTGAVVTGPDAADFTAVSDLPLPGMIQPFQSAVWLVELTPSSPGDKTAALEISHDGGVTSIPLTGLGLDDEVEEGRGSYYACNSAGDVRGVAPVLLALALLLLPRRRRARR